LTEAGIERNSFGEKYSVYSLRHFYAVNALQNGAGVEVTRNMGTSVQMVQEYYGKHRSNNRIPLSCFSSHDNRLTAPCVFDGPIKGESFRTYVEQQLVRVLRTGDIVVMDNLGSHKSPSVRQMIQKAAARLWYPYSPDLNPIEQVFAKIKHWMRIAKKRTIDDACDHIGHLVRSVMSDECSNYFVNAGYANIKA